MITMAIDSHVGLSRTHFRDMKDLVGSKTSLFAPLSNIG